MTDPTQPNHEPTEPAPPYGTPAYEQWYARNYPEQYAATRPPRPKRKHHFVRNTLSVAAGVVAAIVAVVVVVAVASSGSETKVGKPSDHTSQVAANDVPTTVPDMPTAPDTPADDPSSTGPTFDALGVSLDYTQTSLDGTDSEAVLTATQVGFYTGPIVDDGYGVNEKPANGTYRVYKITMKVTKGSFDVSSQGFRYQAANAQVFSEGGGNTYASGYDMAHELSFAGAAAGQTVVGEIIFDVPAGHGKLTVVDYDNTVLGGWTV